MPACRHSLREALPLLYSRACVVTGSCNENRKACYMSLQHRGLWRSRDKRMIGGVCGGIAEWLSWPPLNVRILYILVSVFSAAVPGIVLYILLWILMPMEPR